MCIIRTLSEYSALSRAKSTQYACPLRFRTQPAHYHFGDQLVVCPFDYRDNHRSARVLKFPLDARLSPIRHLQLTSRVEVANVKLDGEAVGLAQFELTDGRGPGTSYLWSLNGQYRLSRLLRATLAYNGRAPADAPVLHTVRLQLSASF